MLHSRQPSVLALGAGSPIINVYWAPPVCTDGGHVASGALHNHPERRGDQPHFIDGKSEAPKQCKVGEQQLFPSLQDFLAHLL